MFPSHDRYSDDMIVRRKINENPYKFVDQLDISLFFECQYEKFPISERQSKVSQFYKALVGFLEYDKADPLSSVINYAKVAAGVVAIAGMAYGLYTFINKQIEPESEHKQGQVRRHKIEARPVAKPQSFEISNKNLHSTLKSVYRRNCVQFWLAKNENHVLLGYALAVLS